MAGITDRSEMMGDDKNDIFLKIVMGKSRWHDAV